MFRFVQLKHSSGFTLDWMIRKDDANEAYFGRRPYEDAGNYTRRLTPFGIATVCAVPLVAVACVAAALLH